MKIFDIFNCNTYYICNNINILVLIHAKIILKYVRDIWYDPMILISFKLKRYEPSVGHNDRCLGQAVHIKTPAILTGIVKYHNTVFF